jgi:hypothetical protein
MSSKNLGDYSYLPIPPRACFQTLYLPVCCEEDPPSSSSSPSAPVTPALERGENPVKVPLFKGDLGGSAGLKTRPNPYPLWSHN